MPKLQSPVYPALIGLIMLASTPLWAQSLSDQVLQLLLRNNTWVGTQSFQDIRVPVAALPGDTSARIYTDISGNLYYNGGLIAGSGGGAVPHNFLSLTHPDTVVGTPVRGDLVVATSAPAWAKFAVGASGTFLRSTGTDPAWSVDGSTLTTLNATNLASGTVALARLPTTIGNAQIDAAAAIAWTKVSKTGSSFADFTTRSATDITSGTLADARLSSLVTLLGSVIGTTGLATGAVTAVKLADFGCTPGQAMQWQSTGWQCGTYGSGSGSVTSVALALPGFITVTGSPVTTTGTLTGALATQAANLVFVGPTGGAAAAPTFRALVNADFPLTGVLAGTYASVTVNTAGLVTAASASLNLATQVGATVLPFANGGTNLSAAADDTAMVSSGTAWVARTLGDCTTTPLGYTQATNLFSCLTTLSGMTAITSTAVTGTTVTATNLVVGGGTAVVGIRTGTKTWDPGSVADGASESTTVTVTGAATGQVCLASQTTLTADILSISAYPSAADTVTVVLQNSTGAPVDVTSGTLRATCIAH